MKAAHLLALASAMALPVASLRLDEQQKRQRHGTDSNFDPRDLRFRAGHLDIPIRHEAQPRRLPPPAAIPQPGPVKGTRKLSRAERKRMKARRF